MEEKWQKRASRENGRLSGPASESMSRKPGSRKKAVFRKTSARDNKGAIPRFHHRLDLNAASTTSTGPASEAHAEDETARPPYPWHDSRRVSRQEYSAAVRDRPAGGLASHLADDVVSQGLDDSPRLPGRHSVRRSRLETSHSPGRSPKASHAQATTSEKSTPSAPRPEMDCKQQDGKEKVEEADKDTDDDTDAEESPRHDRVDNGEEKEVGSDDGKQAPGANGTKVEAEEACPPGRADDAEAEEEVGARPGEEQAGLEAGGVRFAPWNIPFQRRLQTMAVTMHCLSIAGMVSIFFFFCAAPLGWPVVVPYLLHMLLSTSHADGRLRGRREWFRRLRWWTFFAAYFPARLHKTHHLPPTRKYIFGYHPHGIISHGAFAAFATDALGFADKFPGITNSLLTLDSNFRIPLYRDYMLALGINSVSRRSIENMLTRGGPNGEGMGRAVTIVVGGARESLEAFPGTYRLVLAQRKGFVKLAVTTGADLVPVLAFGENELYGQLSPRTHPTLHRLQMWVLRTLKFTLPFLHGRGIFNYDVGLLPYRRPLNIVVGAPIKVVQASKEKMDMAEVDRLHAAYVEELTRIWNTYKDAFARGREEDMTLLE